MGCTSSSIHPLSSFIPSIRSYEFKTVIGQGGFALVKEMARQDGKLVAVKEVDIKRMIKNGKSIEILFSELDSLKSVRQIPFIVQFYSAFYDQEKCFFVMEPLYGGDLRYYLKNCEEFSEEHIVYLIACIGTALCHIHSRNILHRDVKPENISLDRHGRPYLTDFGISYHEKQSHLLVSTSTSGTLPYLAPETLTATHRHSYHADYWSLGVTAYELLYKYRPYKNHCPKEFITFVDHHYSHIWKALPTIPIVSYELMQFYCRPMTLPTTSINTPYYANSTDECGGTVCEVNKGDLSLANPLSSHPSPASHLSNTPDSHGSNILPLPPDSMKSSQLPSPFALSFPLLSSGQEMTSECEDFLSSLLDPRIHMRYGAGLSPQLFLQHDWFQRHSITSPESLFRQKPSFIPNLKKLSHHLNLKFEKLNHQIKFESQGTKVGQAPHPSSMNPPPLSPVSDGMVRGFSPVSLPPQYSNSHIFHQGSEGSFYGSSRVNGHLNSHSNNHLILPFSEEKGLAKEILDRLKLFYYNCEEDESERQLNRREEKKNEKDGLHSSISLPLSSSHNLPGCYNPANSTIVLPFESKSTSVCVNSTGINEEHLHPVNHAIVGQPSLIVTEI